MTRSNADRGREHQRRVLQRGRRPSSRDDNTTCAPSPISSLQRGTAWPSPPAPASCSLPRTSASAARTSSSLSRCRRSCDCVPVALLAGSGPSRRAAVDGALAREAAGVLRLIDCALTAHGRQHDYVTSAWRERAFDFAPGRSLTCDHGRGDALARRAARVRMPVPRPIRRHGRAPRRRHGPTDRPAGTHPARLTRLEPAAAARLQRRHRGKRALPRRQVRAPAIAGAGGQRGRAGRRWAPAIGGRERAGPRRGGSVARPAAVSFHARAASALGVTSP
jgi:hypothetical protein